MRRFEKRGLLAINPRAFFDLFPEPPKREVKLQGKLAIVEIRGPLVHHDEGFFDSYDGIAARVAEACAGSAETIVLKIDSPGGDVSGCFDTSRELRARAAAAGKTLVTYVDGMACSAAYALACAGTKISVPPTGVAGSIGVVNCRADATVLDAAMGIRFEITTSGTRKADGNPHVALSEEESAETQRLVDAMANVFFETVADLRSVVTVEALASLQARVLLGAEAVATGLADTVQSFDEMIATLMAAPGEGSKMASKYEEARAALAEAAKGDDEEAKRASRALAAMDASDAPADEEKDEDEAVAAEAPADEEKDEEKDEAVAASAPAASTAESRLAALELRLEAQDRQAFLATRPDLAPEFVASVASLPLADIKRIVKTMPKRVVAKPAAAASARGTVPADAVTGGARLPAEAKRALDEAMGLATVQSTGVQHTVHTLTLGAPVPVKIGKGA